MSPALREKTQFCWLSKDDGGAAELLYTLYSPYYISIVPRINPQIMYLLSPKLGLLRFWEIPSAIASRRYAPTLPSPFHLLGSRRYSQDFTHYLSIPVARPNIDVQGGRAEEGSRAQQCDVLPWRRAAFQSGIARNRARSSPIVSRVRNPCSVSSRLTRLPSVTGSSSSTCAAPLPRKQSALMPSRK